MKVKMTNGVDVIEVLKGAVGIYKNVGFTVIKETEKADADENVPRGTKSENDEFEELLEKPISQWTKQEVKEFATAKGLDISGTKNASEAKEIIKEFLGM